MALLDVLTRKESITKANGAQCASFGTGEIALRARGYVDFAENRFSEGMAPALSVIDDALIIKKSSARRSMVQLILIFQRYGI